jgi:hypothetical protein
MSSIMCEAEALAATEHSLWHKNLTASDLADCSLAPDCYSVQNDSIRDQERYPIVEQ